MDDVHRLDQDAQVLQRRGADHLAVVGLELALHRERRDRAVARELQVVRLVGQVVDEQVVVGQLVGRARCAVALQVLRRRRQHALGLGQAAHGDGRVVLELAVADGHVDAAVQQVGVAVGGHDLHPQIRVARGELGQQRRDDDHAERQRRRHPQQPRRLEHGLVDGAFGLAHLAQQRLAAAVEGFAHVGEEQPPRVALHQPRGQALFQRRQVAAGRGVGQAQRLGRPRQAAQFGHLHEQFDLGPAVHARFTDP